MSKGLEAFDDLTSNYPKDYVNSYDLILDYIKALEIIKRNNMLKFDLEWELDNNLITQEEYDLLKEVLL